MKLKMRRHLLVPVRWQRQRHQPRRTRSITKEYL